jgi:iron complex transport system substrate-binding protein
VRILSLLPSATEIVYALGLEDDLVGVTHECDWPPRARTKRSVTSSSLPGGSDAAEVDRLVSASVVDGEPIYRIDADAIRDLRPDLVLSQDLCAVCAVPSGYVNQALDVLGCRADVVSLDPSSLDEVLDCILQVASATRTEGRAEALVATLRERLENVRHAVAAELPKRRPRTFALEWSDPPFNGGHWIPDMIELAGGEPVLGSFRAPSERVSWEQIEQVAPEVVVFMPCGYDLDAAASEAENLLERSELARVEALFAVDATSYFSRPGPRLVDGVEILASALHPGAVPEPPPGRIRGFRRVGREWRPR